ncbi:MAG: hypothetical protein QXW37_08440 [Candidatus Nitrosotenuis sp.]
MAGGTIEYAPDLPKPASMLGQNDEYTTLFVTEAGEFIYLSTEEQAKAKAKKLMSRFKPEEWWAQTVSRYKQGTEEYICAFLVKDFSKGSRIDLSTRSQDQFWLGRFEIGIPKMGFDTETQSDTYGERVPVVMTTMKTNGEVEKVPVLGKRGWYSFHKPTPEILKMYQKMAGETADGKVTEYVYVLQNGGRNIGEQDPDQFWKTTVDQMTVLDRNLKRKAREIGPENASRVLQ